MSERNLNFEQGVDRKGTRCLKYDFAVQRVITTADGDRRTGE